MSSLEDLVRRTRRSARFEIERASNQQWYWVFRAAGNLEVVAVSETYTSKAACQHGIQVLKLQANGAQVVDNT